MPDLADFAAGPDGAHAAVAQAALDALGQLELHVEQLVDLFTLGQTASSFAANALARFGGLAQTVVAQGQQIAALTARVNALEHPTSPEG